MTFTRVCARFPTRAAAERALRWAGSVYSFRLEVVRHRCQNPRHQREPWLLVSTVTIEEETPAPAREPAAAAARNG